MDNWRKAIVVATLNIAWMFVVSAGLAWVYTGEFDASLALMLGAMLLPLLAGAVSVLLWLEYRAARRQPGAQAKSWTAPQAWAGSAPSGQTS